MNIMIVRIPFKLIIILARSSPVNLIKFKFRITFYSSAFLIIKKIVLKMYNCFSPILLSKRRRLEYETEGLIRQNYNNLYDD